MNNLGSSEQPDSPPEGAEPYAAIVAELESERDHFKTERDEYKKLYMLFREENERLKRGLIGKKPERLPNDAQLSLAILGLCLSSEEAVSSDEPVEADKADEEPTQTVPEHERRKAKRAPLPEHLLRVPIELLPPEVEREGLENFIHIGTEVREVLEHRPSSHVVVQLIRKKFMRKPDESVSESGAEQDESESDGPPRTKVLVSELPELPIERGLAGPGVLADTIVRRWQDHLPLNRLQNIYARQGMALARSTLCGWHIQLSEIAQPLVAAMRLDALQSPYLCTDATGVLVQAKERCKNGHFWVLVAPKRHVLFEFSEKHNSAAVDDLLGDYKGYLVADAHVVYDHLYNSGDVTEVGCWCHCRRYFIESVQSDPIRAKAALAPVSALFRIERSIATAPRKKREAIRRKKSQALVDQFFHWCKAEQELVLDESPISKAIRYALNQQQALREFLKDGRLPLHNNISELNLRRQAIGRKNWVFVGSEDGASANTTFVSLLASCQMHRIEPWAYLRDLFCLLPSWPAKRVLDLAPVNWNKTFQQSDTQQRLVSNVFRRAVIEAT